MKKRLLIVLLALLVAFPSYAGIADRAQNVVAVYGDPAPTVTYTFTDNSAVTLQAAYVAGGGTWLSGGKVPVGVLVTVETNAARIAFGGTTATASVGHVMSAGDSFRILSGGWADTMSIAPDTAGSYPVLQITLER